MANYFSQKPTYKQCTSKSIEKEVEFLKLDEPYSNGTDTFRYSLNKLHSNQVKLCKNLTEVYDELCAWKD